MRVERPLHLAVDVSTSPELGVTVRASGPVDAVNAWMLREPLRAALEHCAVTLDVGEVSLFGAAGVHVLEEARREAAHHGRDLRVVGADGEAGRILRLVHREDLLAA